MPKILIVTASYNAEQTISETVDCTKNLCLNNSNIVHLVKDGISKDKTLEILKDFSHIEIISSKDEGIFNAFNQGANYIEWDFIYYLNADDVLTEAGLQKLDWISKNGDQKYNYCFSIEVIRKKNKNILYRSKKINTLRVMTGYMPPHPGMVISKNTFKSFDEKFKVSADYKFFLEIWKKKNSIFKNYDDIISHMKEGGNSQTIQGRIKSFNEDALILSEYYGKFLGYIISSLKKIRGIIKWYLV